MPSAEAPLRGSRRLRTRVQSAARARGSHVEAPHVYMSCFRIKRDGALPIVEGARSSPKRSNERDDLSDLRRCESFDGLHFPHTRSHRHCDLAIALPLSVT